jgi:hypothetical protein
MTIETWAIVLTLAGGFGLHLFYFGRGMGEMKGDLKHLATSFDEFKSHHYIPRDEYEARHKELKDLVNTFIEAVKSKPH